MAVSTSKTDKSASTLNNVAAEESYWDDLPPLILEMIYSSLTVLERYRCSMVCKSWFDAFYTPRLWWHLNVRENTFIRRRYDPFKGYQTSISHQRVQRYLAKVGHFVKTLVVHPMQEFYYLYEFIKVLSCFLEFFDEYPMPLMETFKFTFACESRGLTGTIVLGTGGKLLEGLKNLLDNLKGVRRLTLNQLLLDEKDVYGLLDKFVTNCCDSLVFLEILNCSKQRCPLFYVGMFHRLQKLIITPAQLTDDVLLMVVQSSELDELVIVQDPYSAHAEPVTSGAWRTAVQHAPQLKVRLELRGATDVELLVQESAPVHAVVYNSPHSIIQPLTMMSFAEQYHGTLTIFAQLGLPRRYGSRSFHGRADSSLVMLVRQCPHLKVLIVRERVSTATVLLLVSEARYLKKLFVRRNAILKRCDWPQQYDWSDAYYEQYRSNCQSYESVEQEVANKLGYPWHMLTDKEFQKLDSESVGYTQLWTRP